MEYKTFLIYGYLVLLGIIFLIFIFFSYYLKFFKISKKPDRILKNTEKKFNFAVLIPARNESKVIKNILESLNNQTYDKSHFKVFVITERENDKSNEIALSYGFNFIVRKEIQNKRTKGFALKEGYDYLIHNNIKFDSLVILDADNIVDKNYLFELNKLKAEGHQVGVGKRYSTNTNASIISASSGLLFSFQSNFVNKSRTELFNKFAINGTGYYVDKKVIEDAGGWIFLGLTEDVELTRYCYYHGVNMGYNPNAIFYDEQPLDYKTMHKQHVRWIWGYFNKNTIKPFKNGGVIYSKTSFLAMLEYRLSMGLFIFIEAAFALHVIYTLVMSIIAFSRLDISWGLIYLGIMVLEIIFMFIICSIANMIELAISGKKINASKTMKFKLCVFGFIFWSDFFFSLLDGFFHPSKKYTREKIKHTGKIDI